MSHRRPPLFYLLLVVLAGCTPVSVQPEHAVDQWQTVHLNGDKIGHRELSRWRQADQLYTREKLALTLRQPGAPVRESETVIEYRESLTGEPLAIYKSIRSETANHRMSAIIKAGQLWVSLDAQKAQAAVPYPIPQPFYLREGLRRALLSQSGNNRELTYYSWSFGNLQFEKIRLRATAITAPEIAATGNAAYAWKITREKSGDTKPPATLFADQQFYTLAEYSQTSGDELALVSCDRECALADFSPVTHVYRQLIRSPYRIPDRALTGKIRYRVAGDFQLNLPETHEQHVERTTQGIELRVCTDCGAETAPDNEALTTALQPNYWLAADSPELQQVVAELLPEPSLDAHAKMWRLTHFVTRHMEEEAYYSGYGTALEAYRSRKGDCTEYALLLAALGRAAGVPTRVVIGIAYNNERFLGRRYVFVPHAWVQAWLGDHWQSFDSGLGDFNAGYIALGFSNGEPAEFIRINEQLHHLSIESAVQLKSR